MKVHRTLASILCLGLSLGCRPAPRGRPVSILLTPEYARALNLTVDGGQIDVWGAAFLPQAPNSVTSLSLCSDERMTLLILQVAILNSDAEGARPPSVRAYPFGGDSPLPIAHDSYVQGGVLPGRLVGFDGGTDITASSATRLEGRFSFTQAVQPPTFCATCPDGLFHLSVSASFSVPGFPEDETPNRGGAPSTPINDDG